MVRKNAKRAKPLAPSMAKEGAHVKKKLRQKMDSDDLASGVYGWALKLLAVLAGLVVTYYIRQLEKRDFKLIHAARYISRNDVTDYLRFNVTCASVKKSDLFVPGCHQEDETMCGRVVMDNFVTPKQVTQLREIAETGMRNRSKLGGPTIMDINSGFVRDSEGLVNIYQPQSRLSNEKKPGSKLFRKKQFNLYRSVVEMIRQAVMKEFGLKTLYFSAPTFITRLIGNESWTPAEIHDEYWHPHVDKENTEHYDYSGLLYLADYNEEFTGGLFSFLDEGTETVIEPSRGRLVMFTAGAENLHVVRKVETGVRYVLSLWFTCDESKHFHNFLDGKVHTHFTRT
ncbi:hypothetical protein PsorP6_013467 [Peronosclerospora sorghi]|uniref:Uncharacterized protein n=1 Tax=Peronosclerospora sorghi TaxID=230839 RepID=A0ACC0VHZ4_9STRA|nr:hypothetical protein PsorP6_013467 [Peronosclerospora sorghi]